MSSEFSIYLTSELKNVQEILDNKGFKVTTYETTPPFYEKKNGKKRVLKIIEKKPGYLDIIWSYENYK